MKKGLLHNIAIFTTLLIAVFVCGITSTHAEVTNPSDVTSIISTVSPEYPKAFDEVTISIKSYAMDLQRSLIRWYVDGKLLSEKTALTQLSVQAGNYGTTKTVKIQVIAADGRVAEKSIFITPSDLSLVWQADTYTPPFYKGKRLYSASSDILMMAIPSGKYDSDKIIFTWKQDADVIPNSGGLGKNTITIPGTLVTREKMIIVEAISVDGTYHARQIVTLSPIFTKVLMYENNPLFGVWYENALVKNQTIASAEFKVAAYPFFFSTKSRFLDDVQYLWSVNGAGATTASGKSSITLQRDQSISKAGLGVEARHKSKILQDAKTSVNLNFK